MEGEDKAQKKVEEGMQVWDLTSKQYSLKNLSSTTNKDTRPELYLIVAAYSPWLCLYNWEPTNNSFPTIGRHCQCLHPFTAALHTYK